MSRIIGIDLGTTNSCVGVVDERGVPQVLSGADGERVTPSWVGFAADARMTADDGGRPSTTSRLRSASETGAGAAETSR